MLLSQNRLKMLRHKRPKKHISEIKHGNDADVLEILQRTKKNGCIQKIFPRTEIVSKWNTRFGLEFPGWTELNWIIFTVPEGLNYTVQSAGADKVTLKHTETVHKVK